MVIVLIIVSDATGTMISIVFLAPAVTIVITVLYLVVALLKILKPMIEALLIPLLKRFKPMIQA